MKDVEMAEWPNLKRFGKSAARLSAVNRKQDLGKRQDATRSIGSRRRQIELLAQAYAEFVLLSLCRNREAKYLKLIEETKIEPSKATNPVSVVLSSVINYGPIKLTRGFRSRDSNAIMWLIKNNVGPSEVAVFQKKHGGGVTEWSRARSGRGAGSTPSAKRNSVRADPLAEIIRKHCKPEKGAIVTVRLKFIGADKFDFVKNVSDGRSGFA